MKPMVPHGSRELLAWCLICFLLCTALGACTKTEKDTIPPEVSDVTATGITATTANICWATDEPATSQVEYGSASGYVIRSPLASSMVEAHTVTLGDLEPSTPYRFRVKSRDASDNRRSSDYATFTTLAARAGTTSSVSQLTGNSSAYDGQAVEVSGQTYLLGSTSGVLLDGQSGLNLSGDVAELHQGFCRLSGVYRAETNSLEVTTAAELAVDYFTVQEGEQADLDLVPVSLDGLAATAPREVASQLPTYISIPQFSPDRPVLPYALYSTGGLYLVLSDCLEVTAEELALLYESATFPLCFSAVQVTGTLVQTPMNEIDLGPGWTGDELDGIVIAESMTAPEPVNTTVSQIHANPASLAFKRVAIDATCLTTGATIAYSEAEVPLGMGVLADDPAQLLFQEQGPRLKTLDPERKTWQLTEGMVSGTLLYPTDEVLTYLDYSAPATKQQVTTQVMPALIIHGVVEQEAEQVSISVMDPTTGDPTEYWGEVVEFQGYALGTSYPLQETAPALTATEVPVNINPVAVGIGSSPTDVSQLAIIGLDSELADQTGEAIWGQYEFRAAVAQVGQSPAKGAPQANTAFFLLSKQEIPADIPTDFYSLNTSASPDDGGVIGPMSGKLASGALVTLTAVPAAGYAFDHWDGDLSGSTNPASITMDSDSSVTAYFTLIPNTYALTVQVGTGGGGYVMIDPAGGTYAEGTPLTLEAVPTAGYAFDHWDGDVSGSTNPTNVTMDSDKEITAYFTPVYTLTVTVTPSGGGSVEVDPADGPYTEGTVVTLTAQTGTNTLDHWTVDSIDMPSSPDSITVTMDSDKNVTAYFLYCG